MPTLIIAKKFDDRVYHPWYFLVYHHDNYSIFNQIFDEFIFVYFIFPGFLSELRKRKQIGKRAGNLNFKLLKEKV